MAMKTGRQGCSQYRHYYTAAGATVDGKTLACARSPGWQLSAQREILQIQRLGKAVGERNIAVRSAGMKVGSKFKSKVFIYLCTFTLT